MIKIMQTIVLLGLQFFAEAGNVVNTTKNYVNAYTGATEAFPSQKGLDNGMKDFYSTELLENARPDMVYAQFAQKQPLPLGHSGTVEWRKFSTFANASELTEGVIPVGQKMTQTYVRAGIKQYGTYVTVSDRLELRHYDPVIMAATEEMAASAAKTQETLIRDFLVARDANDLFCDNVGGSKGEAKTCAQMYADNTNGWAKLTPTMINKAVRIMKKNNVPNINGYYVMVVNPSCTYDLRQSAEWIDAHKYGEQEEIYTGEIGRMHGVRFIEDSYAPVLTDATHRNGSYASGTNNGAVYANFLFGKDSFAIIDPAKGGLEMIVKDKEEAGGPLNQFSTIGYKFETGCALLYPERCLTVWSVSSFSATDEAN